MTRVTHLLRTKRFHIWYDRQGRAGMWPTLCIARSGRNGSPAGFGPKMWPHWVTWCLRPWMAYPDNGGIVMLCHRAHRPRRPRINLADECPSCHEDHDFVDPCPWLAEQHAQRGA